MQVYTVLWVLTIMEYLDCHLSGTGNALHVFSDKWVKYTLKQKWNLSLFTGSRVEFSKWFGHPPSLLSTISNANNSWTLWHKAKNYPYTTLELALLPVQYGNGRQNSESSTQYFKDLISSNLLKPFFLSMCLIYQLHKLPKKNTFIAFVLNFLTKCFKAEA